MAFRYIPNPPVIEGWFHQTTQPNLVLQDQLAANVPIKPNFWKFNFDDSAFWQSATPSRIPLVDLPTFGGYPLVPTFTKTNYDDSAYWQFATPSRIPLVDMPVGGGFPFMPTFWKFNYDDYAYWVRDSYPIPPLRMPIGGGFPFKPRQWKRDYDEGSVWQIKPRQISINLRPNFITPLLPRRWLFDYDDHSNWIPPRSQRPAGPPLYVEFVYAVILGN